MSFIRRRKAPANPVRNDEEKEKDKKKVIKAKIIEGEKITIKRWSCVDSCCWFVGLICSIWWFLLFLYNAMPASFPQYVAEAITGPLPDPPGVKLRKEGLTVCGWVVQEEVVGWHLWGIVQKVPFPFLFLLYSDLNMFQWLVCLN